MQQPTSSAPDTAIGFTVVDCNLVKALEAAMSDINNSFGRGSVIRLGSAAYSKALEVDIENLIVCQPDHGEMALENLEQ